LNRFVLAVIFIFAIFAGPGCETLGSGDGGDDDLPNVYQPATNNANCLEIEYDSDGAMSVHPGEGDFCTHVADRPDRARCVIPESRGTDRGPWVDVETVPAEVFYNYCPLEES